MRRFEGKRILVTGAAGGIGRAALHLFQTEGAIVAANDRGLSGVDAEAIIPGDLTDPDFVDALAETAEREFGGLDILVNNAGLMRRGPVTTASDEDYRLSMAVNVEAPFRLCRAAIPIMAAAGGGAIVNTASCWGLRPGPDHAIYCVSNTSAH